MKRALAFVFTAILFTLICSCKPSQIAMDDIACFRLVNQKVSIKLRQELGDNYESMEKNIRLIMNFYFDEHGKIDSIKFVKSNLVDLNADESQVKKQLLKDDYACLWETYYNDELKPNFVVVTFNPKLLH